jgi:hypothetical protein
LTTWKIISEKRVLEFEKTVIEEIGEKTLGKSRAQFGLSMMMTTITTIFNYSNMKLSGEVRLLKL